MMPRGESELHVPKMAQQRDLSTLKRTLIRIQTYQNKGDAAQIAPSPCIPRFFAIGQNRADYSPAGMYLANQSSARTSTSVRCSGFTNPWPSLG
jgi:hypothetical protein